MLGRSLRTKLRPTRGFAGGTLSPRTTLPGFGGGQPDSRSSSDSRHRNSDYVPKRNATKFAYPEGMTDYENDWAEEAEYPEIPETHSWNEHRRQRLQDKLDWHAKIRNASCPEAKNLEWNMPRQFGYRVFQISENRFEYDSLKAYKFITRTHVASNTQLPSQYSSPEMQEKVDHFKNLVKQPLLDVLAFELDIPRSYEVDFNALATRTDYKRSQTLIPQMNRAILNVLGKEVDYLKDCQVDVDPNVQAFWHLGGQEAPSARRGRRKGNQEAKGRTKARYVKPDDPIEENIHYVSRSLLQVRCKDPPENFLHPSDPLCQRSEEIPDRFPHFLQAYGFSRPQPDPSRFANFIPGHWSGDAHRCNLIAFHPRDYLLIKERMDNQYWNTKEETEEALLSQAMLASFGRLLPQAFYHGFDQFNDLEYPFSTQTVITNGLDWSFFAYQLNTIKLDELSITRNSKQNVIWGTQSDTIFDKEKKGELNDAVISNLLRFYLNPPRPIPLENPTPYLSTPIQEWEDERSRILTFFNFRDMVCQRPYRSDVLLCRKPPEVHEYEYIYKIYFNAMPLDKRLKHFELPSGFPGYNPYILPYKIRDPTYKPKGVRRLIAEVTEQKEKEAEELARQAEAAKYGMAARPKKHRK